MHKPPSPSLSILHTMRAVAITLFCSLVAYSSGNATDVEVNTSTQASSGFLDATISPFSVCLNQAPNTGYIGQFGGNIGTSNSLKLYWQQAGYDGTRMKRGVEFCSPLVTYKEGWWGFKFHLPSPGFPKDKTLGIAQLFQFGYCNSWNMMLNVVNGSLRMQHRSSCGSPADVQLVSSISYNAWNSLVIHFVASHQNAGTMEVWYNNAKVYTATNINFGFGTWNGDTLASGNEISFAGGMYCYDDGNYTPGETRTMYFDNICEIVGNPPNAFTTATP